MPDDLDAGGDRLAAAVAELYGGPPEEFTGRRGELATAARDAGDRAAAKSIGALRRPTRAAWVVNRLARTDADAPGKLAELGAALDAAQRAGEAARLRELSAERWALLDGLTAQALVAAGVQDAPPSLRDEVSQTLAAVLADPGVAAEFAAATLTRAVQWSGFGLVTDAGGGGAGEDSPGDDDFLSAWGAPAAPARRAASRGGSSGARDAGADRAATADDNVATAGDAGAADGAGGARSLSTRSSRLAAAEATGSAGGAGAAEATGSAGGAGAAGKTARGGAGGRTLRAVASDGKPTQAERREEAERRRAADAERQAAAVRQLAAEQAARRREQYAEAERKLAEATAAASEASEAEDRIEAEVRELEQQLTRAREDLAAARMRARRADFAERRAAQALERLPRP